jgi:hypothetical protein
MRQRVIKLLIFAILLYVAIQAIVGRDVRAQTNWQHLSTAEGDLPPPSASKQQVAAMIVDLDGNGINDFVIGSRQTPGPSLVWYRRDAAGWTRFVIDNRVLPLEAGAAHYDIDGDGDQDLALGGNAQSNQIWWWENPHPNHAAGVEWTRRLIKNSGAKKHHDMMFGNFDDDPRIEFVYWNQGAGSLNMVEIPANPRATEPWVGTTSLQETTPGSRVVGSDVQLYLASVVFSGIGSKSEGLAQADVDGDGLIDIIGGGYWFKYSGGAYTAQRIETGPFLRVAAGQLIPGGRPEIVQIPGDASGAGRWFEWDGANWVGHNLPVGEIIHGHTLDLGDVNSDGHLDIFMAEMRFADSRYPNARTLVLLGNSQGDFNVETVATGYGNHESQLGDLDGDGDLDILGKPFTWDTPRVDIWLNGGTPPVSECPSPLDRWRTHVIDANRPSKAVFVDTADVDGDGRPDVVSGGWWYRNPGQLGGVWQRQTIGQSFDQLAVIDDFDGDGDPDLLGTTWDGANTQQKHKGDHLVWARNNGSGQFTILDNVQPGNGDFLQGAISGSFAPGTRQVILSWHNAAPLQGVTIPTDPTTTQWTTTTISPASQGEDLSAADVDGDGDLDLLLGTTWLENEGNGWAEHTLHQTNKNADRNRAVDLSGDGRPDAVVGYEAISQPGLLAWYEAPANPTQPWTEHIIDTIIGPMSLDVGDVDGDGDTDIVAGEHHKAKPQLGRVFVYENTGAGFQRYQVAVGDEHHDGTQLVDIDGDNDLDIVSIGWEHGRVILYELVGCSTAPDPQVTPTRTATPRPRATATPGPGPTATATAPPDGPTPTVTPTADPRAGDGHVYYLSSTSAGRVGGIPFGDEDVLRYDEGAGAWSLFFDGSDVGLTKADVDAIHMRHDGAMLMSLTDPFKLDGVGMVDNADVLHFAPTSLGENTAGTFSLYFDASDVGLTTAAENVDGITELAGGQLLLTVESEASVTDIKALDEDLLAFTPSRVGNTTAGSWSLFFQGADIGLSAKAEDVRGVVLMADHLYLTSGAFQIGSVRGGPADIIRCQLVTDGAHTSCAGGPSIQWRGGQNGFGDEIIDGLWFTVANDDGP